MSEQLEGIGTPPEFALEKLSQENEELRRKLKDYDAQERAENNITRTKLTRHQMMQVIKKNNPDIKIGSDLFREALVVEALNQEGQNLKRLAEFTGMSKGEVRNHLIKVEHKIQAAQREFAEQVKQKLEQQQNEQATENNDAEREGANTDAGNIETQAEVSGQAPDPYDGDV